MSNRAEVPYLQGEFPEGGQAKINFSTFTESVPARLGEQKVSRWETYPGYLVHPLDEGDPLTYERLKDYSVTSLAQDLFKSAINAVQANHAGDLESQNYYESEAANNLLYYRDYPDVTTEALELAQQANDEGWPFVAATNGSFPIAIKYRDLPANFDPALPIEVETTVPYLTVLNHQKGSDKIFHPVDRNWCVKIDYQKLFQHLGNRLVLKPEGELDPEKEEEMIESILGYAGLDAAPMWGEGILKDAWIQPVAMMLLPYRNNQKLFERLVAAAHSQDQGVDHKNFIQRVLRLIQPRDSAVLSPNDIKSLKKGVRAGAWNIPGQYNDPESLAKLETFLGLSIVPYIQDKEFMSRLADEITEEEQYYME